MDGLQAWSYGASIMTFLVPMIAFSIVALALLVLYTKPEVVPGQVTRGNRTFPIIANRFPGKPQPGAQPGAQAKTDESASE